MRDTVDAEIVEQLEKMLELARAGEITGLAYWYDNGATQTFGFQSLTEHGQLLAAASLGGLATRKHECESEKS